MMGPAVQVVPPAALPVTVDELCQFCRVEKGTEDDFLLRLARSATAQLDGYGGRLGRALVCSTWRQSFGQSPHLDKPQMRLKLPNVASAKLIFLDQSGQEGQPLESGFSLRQDAIGWFVLPDRGSGWPFPRGVVEYVAGYGDGPDDVPEPIREAICLMVQSSYKLTADDANLRNETTDNLGARGFFGPEIMRNATTAHIRDLLAPFRWRPM